MRLTNQNEIKAYYAGKKRGVALYARWKDGIQYVGSSSQTLYRALEELTHLENGALEAFSKGAEIWTDHL